MTVRVRVLYFASVREKVGRDAEEIELPAGVETLAALRAHLMSRGGAWAEALAGERALRAAVNQEMAAPAAPVRPGDEVAFFPPVTGG